MLKNPEIFAEVFAIFWLSNWQNSELSRVLNKRPWQFNFNSCILSRIFVPKLHLCSLLRNLQFCTIFSAYLPFCWVSQQFYEKKIDYPNLYTKRQLFLFMQKVCKHTLQVEIEVSNCCRIKHFNGYNRFETNIFSIFHAWNDFFSME